MDSYLPYLAVGISVAAFLFQSFGSIAKLRERLTAVETKIEIFWSVIQKSMVDVIHSPHTPDLDKLLDKFKENNLSLDEAEELKCMLTITNGLDGNKLIAKVMILGRLEQILYEFRRKKKQWC